MKKNRYLQIILFLLLILSEIYINNASKVYIDLIGVFLLIYVINFSLSIQNMILISLIADLIGFWYLGTHLLAIIIVSMVTDRLTNYFSLLNLLQKFLYMFFFYALMVSLILLIGKISHNYFINLAGFLFEILLCPILFLIIKTIREQNKNNDFIYY